MSQVLIVEDEVILAKNLRSKLQAHGHKAAVVHTGENAVKAFSKTVPDVVLLDVRLPDVDGITLLPRLKAESPATSFIILTAHGNERIAVDGNVKRKGAPGNLSTKHPYVSRFTFHESSTECTTNRDSTT